MTKEQIIAQLKNDIFCRLAPSTVCKGVGVFAIKDIPSGTDPFKGCNEVKFLKIPEKEFEGVDDEVMRLFKDLLVRKDGHYYAPDHGLQAVDISYFLNHSKEAANMVVVDGGLAFVAAREIRQGEELLVDYDTYDGQTGEVVAGEGAPEKDCKE